MGSLLLGWGVQGSCPPRSAFLLVYSIRFCWRSLFNCSWGGGNGRLLFSRAQSLCHCLFWACCRSTIHSSSCYERRKDHKMTQRGVSEGVSLGMATAAEWLHSCSPGTWKILLFTTAYSLPLYFSCLLSTLKARNQNPFPDSTYIGQGQAGRRHAEHLNRLICLWQFPVISGSLLDLSLWHRSLPWALASNHCNLDVPQMFQTETPSYIFDLGLPWL